MDTTNDPAYWREQFTTAANDRDRLRKRLDAVNNYLTSYRRRISQLADILRYNGITLPPPQQDELREIQTEATAPENLIQGTPILLEPGAITVAGWSPDDGPGAKMTEVHAMFTVPGLDATFVVTFASPHTLSNLIEALESYRDAIWPGKGTS